MSNTSRGTAWDGDEPYNWDQHDPIHVFEDGWTISPVLTPHDRTLEARLFDGMACITGGEWDKRLESGSHKLLSLRDMEGKPQATILLGDANWVIESRAGHTYAPYATCRQGDQTPRCLGGNPVIALQFCPRGYMAGDPGESSEITRRIKAWFEALPTAPEFEGYKCGDFVRKDAQEFLRTRKLDRGMAEEAERMEVW